MLLLTAIFEKTVPNAKMNILGCLERISQEEREAQR